MKTRKEKIWEQQENQSKKSLSLNFFEFVFFYLLKIVNSIFKPIGRLRFGLIYYDKIGRMLGNTEYYLRNKSINNINKKNIDILVSGKPFNRQVLNMFKRKVKIIQSKNFYNFLSGIKKKKKMIKFGST